MGIINQQTSLGGHHIAAVNPSFVAGCCRDQPPGGRHRLHHLSDRLRSGERLASCIAPARGDAWAEGLSEMFQVYPLGAGIFVYIIYIMYGRIWMNLGITRSKVDLFGTFLARGI